jgi:hypothetical protein
VYNTTKDDKAMNWSENFSLDVIKSTGMTSCKGSNDKTYMVDIISCEDLIYSFQ